MDNWTCCSFFESGSEDENINVFGFNFALFLFLLTFGIYGQPFLWRGESIERNVG